MADTKVYVPVVAAFDKNGSLLPLELSLENGRTYILTGLLIYVRRQWKLEERAITTRAALMEGRVICFLNETPQLPEIISDTGSLSGVIVKNSAHSNTRLELG